ncbi:MAG: nucleotide exchange factor GrpE [Proteobacteria bacterium]|nr:nucleotide exchange factor GrpE [Pseudomonadota bacterium]
MSYSDDSRPEQLAADAAPTIDDDGSVESGQALEAEVASLREQVMRYAAEAENTRRRAEKESNDARAFAIQRFGRDLLGVADNLQRALQAAPRGSEDPAVKNLVLGIEMTEKELQSAFDKNGLKRVEPAAGDKFDPNLHQAMMEEPSSEVAGGAVVRTLQAGYQLYGRIVRPALVITAVRGSAAAAEPSAAATDGAGGAYPANDAAGPGASVNKTA